ncbi:PLP-dependent aminotransferase family protein [Bradyrhizobium sp. C9]|uniref:MocR-like pyridoxine biosynthesis transcription factor PdxR n=1 Tax=Bradyrhizobium sp. C9 TaxID=142585 RepID=UPI001303FB4F|nr:PLP-dependent aminotransferase family protein [Bradyrhizobium sp. C9]
MNAIEIEKSSSTSIQQQLYDRIRAAIVEGRIQSGERVPSTRSLAVQLGIARGTIDITYARLTSEGYLVARGQRGTIVAPEFRSGARPAELLAAPMSANDPAPTEMPPPLRLGVPALDLFPRKVWARLAAREARKLSAARLFHAYPMGVPALREAIVAYLAVARGIVCRPDQVVVTSGYQGALSLVASLLLKPNDQVWLEDPGYVFAQQAFEQLSMRIVPIPVDDEGLRVDDARASHPDARLAVVTATHQFPLGMPLSPRRRAALLAWAADRDAWVLEDDYDCEFHYSGRKPAALKSVDAADRVFYAGSFSKTLFPSLRLGYLVLPAAFVATAERTCRMLHRGAAAFEQSVAAAFMSEGYFARHLRRMRSHYRARRKALADELERQFGADVRISLQPGGLHILVRFPNHGPDVRLADQARQHGLAPVPLSERSLAHHAGEGLLMSFTNIAEQDAAEVVALLRLTITGR